MDHQIFVEMRLQQGVSFSIRKAMSDGFAYFGKAVGPYIGYCLVSGLIMILASMFASAIPFMIGSMALKATLSPAFVIGFAIYNRKLQTGNSPEFGNFFDGFRSNFQQLFIANLLLVLVTTGLSAGLILPYLNEFEAMVQGIAGDPEALSSVVAEMLAKVTENWWMFLLYGIAAFIIQVLYMQVNYFIVFYDFGFWEALEASRQLMQKVLLKAILYFIVIFILMVVGGVVTLGVGLLFLYPAAMLMSYSMFEQIAGFPTPEGAIEDDLIIS